MKHLNLMNVLVGLVVIALVAQLYLFLFNRPLYCEISMWGQINSVPAFCLKDAVKDILAH